MALLRKTARSIDALNSAMFTGRCYHWIYTFAAGESASAPDGR
jgi:hypothetical protein